MYRSGREHVVSTVSGIWARHGARCRDLLPADSMSVPLSLMEVVADLEAAFGIAIPDDELSELDLEREPVAALVELVERLRS
jgi:acyl carrier protein